MAIQLEAGAPSRLVVVVFGDVAPERQLDLPNGVIVVWTAGVVVTVTGLGPGGDSRRAAARRFCFTSAVTSTATPSLAQSWVNPLPARLHKPAFGIFVLWVAADSIRLWLGERWPEGWEFLGPGVWFAAALTLAVGLARRLPAQNVVAVAALAVANVTPSITAQRPRVSDVSGVNS